MKKQGIMILTMLILGSAAVYANGAQDENEEGYGAGGGPRGGEGRFIEGPMGPGRFDPSVIYDEEGNPVELEEITVEGSLVLEEGTMPYLETKDGKVFLMVPPPVIFQLGLEGGESVKVRGYDIPRTPWGQETESVFLKVTDAEIDGKQIVLLGGPGRQGGRGRGRQNSGQ